MSNPSPSPAPDLTGRKAQCVCGRVRPSSTTLARFVYQGPGSRSATEVCVCGYDSVAHHEDIRLGAVSPTLRNCTMFCPRGDLGYDSYWCGCEEYQQATYRNSEHILGRRLA